MKQTPFPQQSNNPFTGLNDDEISNWEKEARGAKYDHKFEDFASMLFFFGGKIIKKDDISDEEYAAGKSYLIIWLRSWAPKHEVKELVAGYILSRIAKDVEINNDK